MIFLTIELLGVVSFALSGAVIGVRRKLDLFGVLILGLTTACGGGVLRDVILGITPPMMFQNPVYALVALGTGLVVFMPTVRRFMERHHKYYEVFMLLTDAVGLGIFTVIGIQIAADVTWDSNIFLMLFVGVVTGCGGGVLRDVMIGDMPRIFVKHFYASASLVGAVIYLAIWSDGDEMLATIVGAISVVVLRCLAAHYHWNLPKVEDPKL